MCLVCVELIKQNMSIPEAERNVSELISVTKPLVVDDPVVMHYIDLLDSMNEMNVEKLDKILTEGTK